MIAVKTLFSTNYKQKVSKCLEKSALKKENEKSVIISKKKNMTAVGEAYLIGILLVKRFVNQKNIYNWE